MLPPSEKNRIKDLLLNGKMAMFEYRLFDTRNILLEVAQWNSMEPSLLKVDYTSIGDHVWVRIRSAFEN